MKALVKFRVYDRIGGEIQDEKTVVKEFQAEMTFRDLITSATERFNLPPTTAHAPKLFDGTFNQLVDIAMDDTVEDRGRYEVDLVRDGDETNEAHGQMFVKTFTCGQLAFKILSRNGPFEARGIRLTDTVEKLKDVLYSVEGTTPDAQRLVYGGKQLEDSRQLADYGVQEGSTIHLCSRLRGC